MKGNPQVISALNAALKRQLTAINQFFLHARMAKNWGLNGFNEYEYTRSIKAMKMADDLIERVLFLEALPNLQDLGKLLIGENVTEVLESDLALLSELRIQSMQAIALSEQEQDYVSRELLEEILEETEEHVDWIEAQQWLIEHAGIKNYLQSQM